MTRTLSTALLAVALTSQASFAQEGPLRRAGRALDNTGKSIRNRVESEVARGQVTIQEREVLNRVARRIEWDKQLASSILQLEVQPGGAVVLRGSVGDVAAKRRAVDLAESTTGVTSVVDELAVKDIKVIETTPAARDIKVIETTPAARVIEVTPPVTTPVQTKVIVKP